MSDFILRKLKPDIIKTVVNFFGSATSTREDKKQELLHPYYNHITSRPKYHKNLFLDKEALNMQTQSKCLSN